MYVSSYFLLQSSREELVSVDDIVRRYLDFWHLLSQPRTDSV